MSDQTYHFTYDFHPVGQGLFASGSISQNHQKEPFFHWVYDCGTSSSQKLIESAIYRLNHFKRLDLVTLSHFDHDHISGICQLAGNFEIDTLMLPYMALEQRLWMAFEEDVRPGDDIMGFF